MIVLIGLIIGYSFFQVQGPVITLFLGYLFVRGFGQVTLGLVSSTTVSKLFGKYRGKALMMTMWGRAIGDGLIPPVIVMLFADFAWPVIFTYLCFFIILVIPLYYWRAGRVAEAAFYPEKISSKPIQKSKANNHYYFLMLINTIMPFFMTVIFFQYHYICSYLDITHQEWANSFVWMTIFLIVGQIFCGYLVDHITTENFGTTIFSYP